MFSRELLIFLAGSLVGDVLLLIAGWRLRQHALNTQASIDSVWDFLMDRAVTEAVIKGNAQFNSPLTVISEDVRRAYAPYITEMARFYRTLGADLTERELFIAFYRRFHDVLLQNICIPLGWTHGSCVSIAVSLAREAVEGHAAAAVAACR